MQKLAWITDPHFNFINHSRLLGFCKDIAEKNPDAVVITGDIGEARSVRGYLTVMENVLKRPIYFALGNHDFYGGSIKEVRDRIKTHVEKSAWLKWLDMESFIQLTETACLVGHSGWADGRFGNPMSRINLNDYFHINEFIGLGLNERFRLLNKLGDEAAAFLKEVLPEAIKRFKFIVLATHVPPFREACWHKNAISDDDWLPHFSSKAMGDVLVEIMQKHPDHKMLVLCGHTHSSGVADILPNLHVKTGKAKYGAPELQEMIEIED